MLTQELLKELLHYNPDTGKFTWLYRNRKWFKSDQAFKAWNTKYANKKAGHTHDYLSIRIFQKRYEAHRLAHLYMTGKLPDNMIDHQDGNGLNNKWCNLRSATATENSQNTRLRSDNKTSIIGVSYCKKRNKFRAEIQIEI